VADHRETEDTYDIDATATLPRFDSLTAVASVAEPVRHDLVATYYDTTDLTLASEGVTIVRRTGGEAPGWHLQLADTAAQHSVRAPLNRATRTVPKQLRSVVLGLVREAPLRPVANVRTHREVHRLLDEAGRVLVEVSDDHFETDIPPLGSHHASTATWRVWKMEPVDGDGSLLEATAALLRHAGALPSSTSSTLAWALADRLPETPQAIPALPRKKKAPAADVVQAWLSRQVAEVRRLDPLVRLDVRYSVHRMRVAIRRLRSALATFRPLLDRDATDPVRGELRWLAHVLGPARDAEVMHERLTRRVTAEPPENVRGPVLARINREMRERYRQAHAQAMETMGSQRYFALLDRLDDLAAGPPFTDLAQGRACDVLPDRVRRDWNRLERQVAIVAETDDPTERADRLHDARKAAKRARYAAEPLSRLYRRDTRRFVKAAKELQSVLGEHHDSIVTQERLYELADRAAVEGENAFTYGVLHAREQATTTESELRFGRRWRAASDTRLRAWLS
jgi:CHAD domain-containing protein